MLSVREEQMTLHLDSAVRVTGLTRSSTINFLDLQRHAPMIEPWKTNKRKESIRINYIRLCLLTLSAVIPVASVGDTDLQLQVACVAVQSSGQLVLQQYTDSSFAL